MNYLIERALQFLIPVGLGILVLLHGRRFFWILGGAAVGFASGIAVALFFEPTAFQMNPGTGFSIDFQTDPGPPIFVAILVGGIIGILLTLRFPKVASGIVGFVGGIVILFIIFELFAVNLPEPVRRTLLLLAGVGAAFVGLRNQNQTMILLSTLLGAGLLLFGSRLDWNDPVSAIIWLLLMLTGIIFQTNALRVQQLKAAAARTVAPSNLTPSG